MTLICKYKIVSCTGREQRVNLSTINDKESGLGNNCDERVIFATPEKIIHSFIRREKYIISNLRTIKSCADFNMSTILLQRFNHWLFTFLRTHVRPSAPGFDT